MSAAIKQITGLEPLNVRLYRTALTHTSVLKQTAGGRHETNERLEFLGDAVLGTVVAEYLFRKFPYEQEGFLTELRSRIVNRESLNALALKIGLDKLVQLDPTQGRAARSRSSCERQSERRSTEGKSVMSGVLHTCNSPAARTWEAVVNGGSLIVSDAFRRRSIMQ